MAMDSRGSRPAMALAASAGKRKAIASLTPPGAIFGSEPLRGLGR